MTQTVGRMYATPAQAEAAVAELRERGFNAHAIQASAVPAAGPAAAMDAEPAVHDTVPAADAAMDELIAADVAPDHASIYAEHLRRGEVLVVVVDPRFGEAIIATQILDRHNPVPVDLPVNEAELARGKWNWHSPAPLSARMGWRVLLDDPAPLSHYFKWRIIKPEPASSRTLDAIRKQSDDPAPLSRKVKMPVLSEEPAPLSRKVKMPILADEPAPLSKKIGWRTLLDRGAPLSQKIGWRLVFEEPAPLSRKVGWRLLLDDPAPLSRLLGWKVLLTTDATPTPHADTASRIP